MPKPSVWVVKLGGAMMASAELGPWLSACTSGGGSVRCVVVVGGGALADDVRALHAVHAFDETLGHELALEAMRMNARVLARLAPGARAAAGTAAVERALAAGRDVVWRPPRPFRAPGLPPSWAATSDSIALWLAQTLDAEAAWLVKSVAPSALGAGRAATLSARGVIDRHFPAQLARAATRARAVAKADLVAFEAARSAGDVGAAGVGLV